MTDALWWFLTQRAGRVEHLTPSECRQLLSTTTIGRLGYSTSDGPRIVPMNYTVAGGGCSSARRRTPRRGAAPTGVRWRSRWTRSTSPGTRLERAGHRRGPQITSANWNCSTSSSSRSLGRGRASAASSAALTTMTGRRVLPHDIH